MTARGKPGGIHGTLPVAGIIGMMGETRIVVRKDAEGVAREAVALWRRHAADAVAARGVFRTLLSGGSTPRRLFELLAAADDVPPWQRTHLFWGDERSVSPDHRDSNFGMTTAALLDAVAVPPQQVHRLAGERPDADAAARDYQAAVAAACGVDPAGPPPAFDLAWLGLGTDAHTASLFPGTAALAERRRWFVANDVPQLSTRRLTATYPLLDAARCVVFLVAGADKAPAVARVMAAEGDVATAPARGVRPAGSLIWVLDRAAAVGLPADRVAGSIDDAD
jgi:6-phosphogluconolactonase